MNKDELKREIISKIKWHSLWNPNDLGKSGGQTVSLSPRTACLTSEEVDFKIFIGATNSQLKNREIALSLFELYLNEVLN